MNNKYIKKEYFHNNGIIEGECKSQGRNLLYKWLEKISFIQIIVSKHEK